MKEKPDSTRSIERYANFFSNALFSEQSFSRISPTHLGIDDFHLGEQIAHHYDGFTWRRSVSRCAPQHCWRHSIIIMMINKQFVSKAAKATVSRRMCVFEAWRLKLGSHNKLVFGVRRRALLHTCNGALEQGNMITNGRRKCENRANSAKWASQWEIECKWNAVSVLCSTMRARSRTLTCKSL